jgi:hypothetical protein|tara:strand:+ start:24565 stop:24729 length:165 start_codon:yes stop_codon:yes gene_type:complete
MIYSIGASKGKFHAKIIIFQVIVFKQIFFILQKIFAGKYIDSTEICAANVQQVF